MKTGSIPSKSGDKQQSDNTEKNETYHKQTEYTGIEILRDSRFHLNLLISDVSDMTGKLKATSSPGLFPPI